MSRRPKLKQIKQAMGGASAQDINGMFEEMMGVRDAEQHIILPKFVGIRNKIIHVYKILMQFATGAIGSDFVELSEPMLQIRQFASEMKESIVFSDSLVEETEEQYSALNKEDLNALYKKLKNNQFTQQLIVQCSKLKRHSKDFDDIKQLRDNFIKQEPGLSFFIFDFSNLDLKKIWASSRVTPMVKKYILNILHVLYKDLFSIYQLVTSPDVDIDKFTDVLMSAIDQLKKQPGLHRCDNAFRRIASSVELLKGRFNNYYRESVASANPTIIIESFIVDVSNQGGADARLTREFKQIIKHMAKVSEQSGRNKDPAIQKLFAMLNKNFEIMERGTKGKSDGKDDADPTWLADIKEADAEQSAVCTDQVEQSAARAEQAEQVTTDDWDTEELDEKQLDYSFDHKNLVDGNVLIGANGYRYTLTKEELDSNCLSATTIAAMHFGFMPDGPLMKQNKELLLSEQPLKDSSEMPPLKDSSEMPPLIE